MTTQERVRRALGPARSELLADGWRIQDGGTNRRALMSARSSARKSYAPRPAAVWGTVNPSTPAVRAPRLPRTRRHATSRNAGSATRLNRSSHWRPDQRPPTGAAWSASAPPAPPPVRRSATARRCSPAASCPATTGAAKPLPPFARCRLSRLGLLRRLRLAPAVPADDPPVHHRPGRPVDGLQPGPAAEPGPSGSTGPSRRCQAGPTLPASPGSGGPQLHRPAATGRR